MFLKYRYRLGYESLCVEVSDSLTWLRFCRIPLGERAPHPSTLMKITKRCGASTVAELNALLVAVGVEAGVIDRGWLRADTTVAPADIKYPTDSGLLTKGITRIATLVDRLQAAGIASGTEFDDQTLLARRGAHRIGSKLRRRSDDATAEVLVITGELADLAETTQVISRTRVRLAGEIPTGKTRRVSLHDDDARPIRKGSLATSTQFGYTGQVTDNRDGIIIDCEIQAAALGVEFVAILRKGQPGKARQIDGW